MRVYTSAVSSDRLNTVALLCLHRAITRPAQG